MKNSALDTKNIWFVLAGDSTTANPPADKGGGGWGRGLLRTLQSPAGGVNYAQNGATTVSFRADKHWEKVISETKKQSGSKLVYVTLQFGHNDQKKDKGISLDAYKKNLRNMAQEVIQAKGKPILVTPLTRRQFNGNTISQSLKEEAAVTIEVAGKDHLYIDLNKASTTYMNQIGPANAEKYNRQKDDRTHLNPHGTEVFGRMVADLIIARIPEIASAFNAIASDTYIWTFGS
ncbi:SGNH hydrolase [Tothia fuscella]|uniref:SGNH hydrolase n=1 Tax=Tothia fuscella TaxID=1048955 RepID=A0A9P4TYD7_9PEZI|nr:SGNH hydrolase [Tothia fuscella]